MIGIKVSLSLSYLANPLLVPTHTLYNESSTTKRYSYQAVYSDHRELDNKISFQTNHNNSDRKPFRSTLILYDRQKTIDRRLG